MKRTTPLVLLALIAIALCGARTARLAAWQGQHLQLLEPDGAPKGVAILLLDGAAPAARKDPVIAKLLDEDYLVVGLDTADWLARATSRHTSCGGRASGLARSVAEIAQRAGVPSRARPVLIGRGAGAALAYSLAQRSSAFQALVTLDFCPQPLAGSTAQCAGEPLDAGSFDTAWYAFFSRANACLAEGRQFAAGHSNARVTEVDGPVGESAEFSALMQWMDPTLGAQTGKEGAFAALPLIEVLTKRSGGDAFVIFLSGDGGWAELDQHVANSLAEEGTPVVGWDSLSYYWQERSPAAASADLAKVIQHYQAAWQRQRVVLVGYSFGANVLPFLVAALPAELRAQVALMGVLSLAPKASFVFHLTDWLGDDSPAGLPTAPQFAALSGVKTLCIRGDDDEESYCPSLPPPNLALTMPGDHHFDGDYAGLAARIRAAFTP